MDNLRFQYPLLINHFHISFGENTFPRIPHLITLASHYKPQLLRGDLHDLQITNTPKPCTYTVCTTSDIEISLYKMLNPLFSNNPLKYFDKAPRWCQLELLPEYQNKNIRVNAILVNQIDKEEFAKQIKELLELKLIQTSSSNHSSPAFLVRNHAEQVRGKARMVINYRKLNQALKFDGYFIPTVENLINQIKTAKYFSKFDAKSGFWQIKLKNSQSTQLTAFSCPQGHYEWIVMPFGLKNAPQIYQKWMNSLFGHLSFVLVYIDDILVFSETHDLHKEHVLAVINILLKNGIILSPKKLVFFKQEIEFLGKKIKKGQIELQDHIYEKLHNFPNNFHTLKQLQSFLGLLNYGRKFIPNLATKSKSLQEKLNESQKQFKEENNGEQPRRWNTDKIKISLTSEQIEEIKQIKLSISKQKILYIPKPMDQIILQTDASDYFWGGALFAKTGKQIEIIAYTSGKFTKPEVNYSTYDKELLAILKSIKSQKIYLFSQNFVIETDNKAVAQFLKRKTIHNPEENVRRIRLLMYLELFIFDVRHIAGYTNIIADLLSRENGKENTTGKF